MEERDVSLEAASLVRTAQRLKKADTKVTMAQLIQQWRSAKGGEDGAGRGKPDSKLWPNKDCCEFLVMRLLSLGVLRVNGVYNSYSMIAYIEAGSKARAVLEGNITPAMHTLVPVTAASAKKAAAAAKKAAAAAKKSDGAAGVTSSSTKPHTKLALAASAPKKQQKASTATGHSCDVIEMVCDDFSPAAATATTATTPWGSAVATAVSSVIELLDSDYEEEDVAVDRNALQELAFDAARDAAATITGGSCMKICGGNDGGADLTSESPRKARKAAAVALVERAAPSSSDDDESDSSSEDEFNDLQDSDLDAFEESSPLGKKKKKRPIGSVQRSSLSANQKKAKQQAPASSREVDSESSEEEGGGRGGFDMSRFTGVN